MLQKLRFHLRQRRYIVRSLAIVVFKLWPENAAAGSAAIFIRAGLAEVDQLHEYQLQAERLGVFVAHFHIPMGLGANHLRDFRSLTRVVEQLSKEYDRIYVFGYSIGGKFAARMARDLNRVDAAFLLDPTDGGPPIFPRSWPQFPVFMGPRRGMVLKPTWILESEFGAAPIYKNIGCVNKGLGSEHFAKSIGESFLHYRFIPGAGHLQLILPPKPGTPKGLCAPGTLPDADIRALGVSFWVEFLQASP